MAVEKEKLLTAMNDANRRYADWEKTHETEETATPFIVGWGKLIAGTGLLLALASPPLGVTMIVVGVVMWAAAPANAPATQAMVDDVAAGGSGAGWGCAAVAGAAGIMLVAGALALAMAMAMMGVQL